MSTDLSRKYSNVHKLYFAAIVVIVAAAATAATATAVAIAILNHSA